MEKMPYQSALDTHMTTSTQAPVAQTQRDVVWSDWRSGLPKAGIRRTQAEYEKAKGSQRLVPEVPEPGRQESERLRGLD